MKFKVLVSAPYFMPVLDEYKKRLAEYDVELIKADVHERLSEDDLLKVLGDKDGLMCGDDRVTEKVLDNSPKLKVISKWGTGIDSIDKKAAEKRGVRVCNTPNAFTEPVSDSVLAYMLCFARKTPWMDKHMRSGRWEKIPGRTLAESTLGIIGFGNIGKAVASKAQAFGMTMYANDIQEIDPAEARKYNVQPISLDELLSKSDFISLNCDLNEHSQHLINEEKFAKMKPGAFLINTARGPVVKELALLKALKENKIGGAALDVFEIEPLNAKSELFQYENCLYAPHNSNSSPKAWNRVHENTVKNLLDVLLKRT